MGLEAFDLKEIKLTHNLRFRITAATILCCIITTLLISSISIFINYKFFEKEITKKLMVLPQNYSKRLDNDFNASKNIISTLHSYISVTFDLKKYNINPKEYIKQYEKDIDFIINIVAENTNKVDGIHTENGIEAIYFTLNPELIGDAREIWYANPEGNGPLKKIDSDPEGDYIQWFYEGNKKMSWYYDSIKRRKGIWSKPYKETDLNVNIISYTEPVFKDNVLIGVTGIDINVESIKNTIKNMKIYDTGYVFLMCDNYDFLIHPVLKPEDNLKLIENSNLKFMTEKMDKENSGIIRYTLKGEDKLLGYFRLSNSWILGVTVPVREVYSSLRIQIILCVIGILFSICIGSGIAIYVGKSISKPVEEITKLIKNTADFNFADNEYQELLTKNKDEIGIMAREMYSMRKMLKETGIHKAAKLQIQSLQREFSLPNKVNMEILYAPAKTVSGDFYHVEKINENLAVGIIWDVSGKGVTAALNTSAFNVLFHEAVLTNEEPIDIISDLNFKIAKFLGEAYIAACCFSFDFQNNTAKIAGAGINQFMYSSPKEHYQEKIVRGPFLGMFQDGIFEQEIFEFKPGDKFYFLTDGLEFMFYNEEIRKQFINISDIKELVKFLSSHLSDRKTEFDSLMDDCTLVAIEIR